MLFNPFAPIYQWQLSTTNARPASAYGTTVTPAQNSKGTYAELIDGALVTEDVWGIYINVNSGDFAAEARCTLLDIGIDEAAGTSYSVVIPDLFCACSGDFITNGLTHMGIHYFFPLFIKAGSSIAARASVEAATVRTLRCWATLFGRPRNPEVTPVGHSVTAYGVTAATSSGTTITPGTTSEGAWTTLGTTTKDHWYWQQGFGISDATMNTFSYFVDLSAGDATTQRLLLENQMWTTDSGERTANRLLMAQRYGHVKSGETIQGRAQCDGTLDDGTYSMIAYGLN